MQNEPLEVKVAILQTDMRYVKDQLNKALAWGRWIGMMVGGYIVINLLELFKVLKTP